MNSSDLLDLLPLAVAVAAALYASVGHGGGSAYVGLLTLCGWSATVIKPTSLSLNILVATLALLQFGRVAAPRLRQFWPFALGSVPMAFAGGGWIPGAKLFGALVALVLATAAARLLLRPPPARDDRDPPLPVAILAGAAIGLLAGATGTGGGIFLTPLLLFAGWARTRTAACISAAFILVNSIAGLLGFVWAHGVPAMPAWELLLAAFGGGLAGSWIGAQRMPPPLFARVLGVVLVVASAKLLLGV